MCACVCVCIDSAQFGLVPIQLGSLNLTFDIRCNRFNDGFSTFCAFYAIRQQHRMAFSHHFVYFLFLFPPSIRIYMKCSCSSSLSILIVSHFLCSSCQINSPGNMGAYNNEAGNFSVFLILQPTKNFAQFDTEMTFGFDLLESS